MFKYSYLCGANVSIFVDTKNLTNIKIKDHILDMINRSVEPLDAAAVHYTLNNSVQPIYSHHANKFDAIVLGREIVQGSIVLNYKDLTYFYQRISPELYVQHLLSNKAFNDKKYFSNYVDYNYLPPFNIYIVENGNIEKRSIRIHVLNNCYISSRGQSIYADDQSIIEEYSFISQSYSFVNYANPNISAYTNPIVYSENEQENINNVSAKSNESKDNKDLKKEKEGPSNTNQETKTISNENGKVKIIKKDGQIEIKNDTNTSSTQTNVAKANDQNKNSSSLVIQNPEMKDDIRNKDSVLGKNPEATYVLMNNLMLPKYANKGVINEKYKQYTKEHFDAVLDFAKNPNKDYKALNTLINKIEYEIPSRYSKDGILDLKLEENLPNNLIEIKDSDTNYLQQTLEENGVNTTGWTFNNYQNNQKVFLKNSRNYSQSLANIYRNERQIVSSQGVLFDVPHLNDITGIPYETLDVINSEKKDYINKYKHLITNYSSNEENLYTYKNRFWLTESLMPNNTFNRGNDDYYIYQSTSGQTFLPNYLTNLEVPSFNESVNKLWSKDAFYSTNTPIDSNFFIDEQFESINFFFNDSVFIDPIRAIYGIANEIELTPQAKSKNNEGVSNLINYINQNYLTSTNPNQDVLTSLLELSKQIYYYGPDGKSTTLYDSWINSQNIRNSRWSVR